MRGLVTAATGRRRHNAKDRPVSVRSVNVVANTRRRNWLDTEDNKMNFFFRKREFPSAHTAALSGAFNDDEIAALEGFSTTITLSAGTDFATQGQTGQEAMVVLSGMAGVVRDGKTVAEVGAGDVIGELALLSNEPRSATLTAITDVQVMVLNRREFASLLDSCPSLNDRVQKLADERQSA